MQITVALCLLERSMCASCLFILVGNFLLPVQCLQEPPPHLLIRKLNKLVVNRLKQDMLTNLCVDVQPILCVVELQSGQTFDGNVKEGYTYYTIGGNHTRQALQELIRENSRLERNRQYTHRQCAVYLPMDPMLAKRLAAKHNIAASNSHEMSTWDWVSK